MFRALTALLIVAVLVGTCLSAPTPDAAPEPAPNKNSSFDGPLLVIRLVYGLLALIGNILVVLLEDLLNGGIIPKQLIELVYQLLPFALNNG